MSLKEEEELVGMHFALTINYRNVHKTYSKQLQSLFLGQCLQLFASVTTFINCTQSETTEEDEEATTARSLMRGN